MVALAAIAVLLIALPAALVAARFRALLVALGLGAYTVALGGLALLLLGPKDLLVRYPALMNVVHPYLVSLWIGLAVVVGTGVLLGLLARMAYQRPVAAGTAPPRRAADASFSSPRARLTARWSGGARQAKTWMRSPLTASVSL